VVELLLHRPLLGGRIERAKGIEAVDHARMITAESDLLWDTDASG
jgi:hypothetical protein